MTTQIVNQQINPNIKFTVAVASGKGGVGKSTTAVNLALALQASGAQVGLLDADIYGPSQGQMLGVTGRASSEDGKRVQPIISYGIQSMSIAYLIDQQDAAMIWRGPMVSSALLQLYRDTLWQDLDYLIIDLPPGTGDIQLTLAQKIPLNGAVVVTTPQDIACLDARRSITMFAKVNVPVLGVVENMSTHICSECGHEEAIFGENGGAQIAEQYSVPLLGRLPLAMAIRQQTDGGKPTVVAEPNNPISLIYKQIAEQLVDKLLLHVKNTKTKFPKIVVEQA